MDKSSTKNPSLSTLFLIHAAGTKIERRYCPHCGMMTAQGKTKNDPAWTCLVCLQPAEPENKDLTK